MATLDTRYVCIYSQQSADMVMGRSNPALGELEQLQVLGALNAPINTVGFEAIQTESRFGKQAPSANNRKVDVRFRPKQCNEVADGLAAICTTTTPDVDLYQVKAINVSQYKHVVRTINKTLYRGLCEQPSEAIGKLLSEMALDLMRNENIYYATQMLSAVGDYFDGTASTVGGGTEQTVKLFNTNGTPNAMSLFRVANQYARKGYSESPIIIGGTSLQAWLFARGIFSGNVDGLDINRVGNFPTFIDHQITTQGDVIASDSNERMVSFIPGTLQAVNWFAYEGEYAQVRPEGSKVKISVLGQTFDYTIYDNFCDDDVVVTLGRGFDLVNLNTLAETDCGAQDSLLSWIVDCDALDCSDINLITPAS